VEFEQGIILLLLGAILGSGGAILTGKTVMKSKGLSDDDLKELLEKLKSKKLLKRDSEE